MLIILVFWMAIVFVSVGPFAPPNATAIVTLMLAALSVSAAIFLILELDSPFHGVIQISPWADAQRVSSSRALTAAGNIGPRSNMLKPVSHPICRCENDGLSGFGEVGQES